MTEIRPATRFLILALATGLGAGRCPKIPGTAGTLIGVLLYWALMGLPWSIYTLVVLILLLLGIWLCDQAAKILENPDPEVVVWDEIVGFLVAMLAAPQGWPWLLAGFVLFRALDILKPGPIGWAERRIQGGVGIMLDDVLAGIATLAVLQTAQVILIYFS